MDPIAIDRLRGEVLEKAGLTPEAESAVLHSWELSHVERLTTSEGPLIFKCATEPFTHEHDNLTAAWQAGVNVPRLRATTRTPTMLGMLMEDLGTPAREASDADGIAAAIQLHNSAAPDFLAPGDTEWLRSLPSRALRSLHLLQRERWEGTDDITITLQQIEKAAPARAEGATLRPFGWVHSEFHPESLIITADGRPFMVDFARAFRGPGLIDLASWAGTVDAPDPDRMRALLEAYVDEGGPAQSIHERGDLPVQNWALEWHRVWVLEWFLDQALLWIADPDGDTAYQRVVRRHATEAASLLRV
ncbi:phosphotransferase family protein [Nocardiopsis alba]|uniref:phosphotransferase family protein n=1 Tax=Nocardiopsis alba TaxID=53437 RepID=UPI00366BE18D